MKKYKLSIILSIPAIIIIIISFIFINKQFISNDKGTINVSLINIDGDLIQEKNIDFKKGDALIDLLTKNFNNVRIENGMLMSIDKLITPGDYSKWICIYVDEKISSVGINDIKYSHGTRISFVMKLSEENEEIK